LGVQIAYRKGRWLTNYKIGFENLSNRDDQVLSDSRIGVIALEPEDIFTNSANAGLDLDDISGFGDDASLGDIELNVFDNSTLLNDPTEKKTLLLKPIYTSYSCVFKA